MPETYLQRMMPLIEKAALGAKQRMSKVSQNAHMLWDVYNRERTLLIFAAAELEKKETTNLGHPLPPVNREGFENYLLSNGVWVESSDSEDAAAAEEN